MRLKTFIYPLLCAAFSVFAALPNQKPLSNPDTNLGPAMPSPPSASNPGGSSNSPSDSVILSDVLGNDRSINIFAGFTRDFATISQRFEDSNANTTILAPINSAIMALPRKPWEDPKDYDVLGAEAYEGEKGEERAHRNMRRFVEAHVVPVSPWREGEKVKTLAGGEVWWEGKEGGIKLIQPGNIEVSSVASKVYNGEVWILKGVRNYV
ncbi:hypothetical protein ONS95_012387 [Cadophora gregata]|uniref:uncharacterized protein n=1 Tax=Cadophora gregata TaxID=51156 RepID=UPI0026DC9C3E|nr:uncharacterized protein ONS95_012387 [Cadophora gregata]KAK0118080.1 hypothetical protein ONS95_012387 [Cadophora gregata]KAK0123147.1 hypothetical protein ONS96_010151 [Cadophora gregata f. sp. sojae]